MERRKAIGMAAVVAAVAIVLVAAVVLQQDSAERSHPDAPLPDLTALEMAALVKLDEPSRKLAVVLQPNEVVYARLTTGTFQRGLNVVDRARSFGLDPTIDDEERPNVYLSGSRTQVLTITAMPEVSSVYLQEDNEALRPVALPVGRPIAVPVPGRPYAGIGFQPADDGVAGLLRHRLTMLAPLADLLVTIDGRPYESAQTWGECQGDACYVSVQGSLEGSADRMDRWSFTGSAATGWFAVIDPNQPPELQGIPRWLVREAERIARADPGAAAAIAKVSNVGGATWDAARPGVITLHYPTNCECCGAVIVLGSQMVADAACLPELLIRVDVDAGRVVETAPAAGVN